MHWEIADDGTLPSACWCGLSWSHTPAERAALAVDVWPTGIPRPRPARTHAALAGLTSTLD